MEQRDPRWDDHLEDAYEDAQNGGGERSPDEDEEVDPELEAWLRDREVNQEEQAFALADQFDEEWRP